MKTLSTKSKFVLPLIVMANYCMAQTDLVPGINYSYNPPGSDNIIHSITVDVCNNESGAASSFDVSMYLYDSGSGNHWVIGTTNLTGLSGNSCVTISNWDIDIDNTSGIPAGTYRLGLWVDSNDDISESDESNNTGLLSGNINYSPNTGINFLPGYFGQLTVFPNPANEQNTVSFSLGQAAKVNIDVFDVSGKNVFTFPAENFSQGKHNINLNCTSLENGFYFYRFSSGSFSETKKFCVMH